VLARVGGGHVGGDGPDSTEESPDDSGLRRYTHTDETRRERGKTHDYSSPPARDGPTNPDL
jgi:hypothetical protein